METLETVRAALGWCTLINFGVLALSSIMLVACGAWVTRIHARMFGLTEADLSRAYLRYLAQYKVVTLSLNFAPYLALSIAL